MLVNFMKLGDIFQSYNNVDPILIFFTNATFQINRMLTLISRLFT